MHNSYFYLNRSTPTELFKLQNKCLLFFVKGFLKILSSFNKNSSQDFKHNYTTNSWDAPLKMDFNSLLCHLLFDKGLKRQNNCCRLLLPQSLYYCQIRPSEGIFKVEKIRAHPAVLTKSYKTTSSWQKWHNVQVCIDKRKIGIKNQWSLK